MFPKIVVPPNHPFFNRLFHHKPSILGYPYFWKHPYMLRWFDLSLKNPIASATTPLLFAAKLSAFAPTRLSSPSADGLMGGLRQWWNICKIVKKWLKEIISHQLVVGCTPTNVPLLGNPYLSPILWISIGYNPQESLENTINTMGTLLGVHPIVPWSHVFSQHPYLAIDIISIWQNHDTSLFYGNQCQQLVGFFGCFLSGKANTWNLGWLLFMMRFLWENYLTVLVYDQFEVMCR